jgi:hypothetical protein
MRPPTPTPRRHEGLASAWALVVGVFALGICCGSVCAAGMLALFN